MKRILSLLLLTALLLCGCAGGQSETQPEASVPTESSGTEATEPSQEPTESTPPEDPFLYAGAEEYLLEPVADYSWEREYAPEYLIIHANSAVVNHRDDPFNPEYIRDIFKEYEVSSHYIIDRSGKIYCFVREDRVAWHAGKGEFAGNEKLTNNMNAYSIGIELLGIGTCEEMGIYMTEQEYAALDPSLAGFTDAQYKALSGLVSDLCSRYGIPADRSHIIGHEEYSQTKWDPGALFDWDRLMKAIG